MYGLWRHTCVGVASLPHRLHVVHELKEGNAKRVGGTPDPLPPRGSCPALQSAARPDNGRGGARSNPRNVAVRDRVKNERPVRKEVVARKEVDRCGGGGGPRCLLGTPRVRNAIDADVPEALSSPWRGAT